MRVQVPSDAELVARCREADALAWELVVDRYSGYVYAIAARVYRLSPEDAEDVFQEVFARVFERLGTLRDGEALRPWIAQVARRICIDRIAERGRAAVPTDDIDDEAIERASEGELDGIEEAMDVHEALAGLEAPCREMLDRFFARDEPYRVIADALDLPMGTVASRISRCLSKLRDVLGDLVETMIAATARGDHESALDADLAFHRHLFTIVGNPVLEVLQDGLAGMLRDTLAARRAKAMRTETPAADGTYRTDTVHRPIVEALAARAQELAESWDRPADAPDPDDIDDPVPDDRTIDHTVDLDADGHDGDDDEDEA